MINVRNFLCVLIDVGALAVTLTLFGLAPAVADVDAISNARTSLSSSLGATSSACISSRRGWRST